MDALAHGRADRLHEAAPFPREGVEDWELGMEEGAAVLRIGNLEYRLEPDSLALQIAGAEGLWLHGERLSEAVGAGLTREGQRWATDAASWTDLGGALELQGVSTLWIGELAEVHDAMWPVPASGACLGDAVEVAVEGVVVDSLEPSFDEHVPEGSLLRCVGAGRPGGPWVEPGPDLELDAGDAGTLLVRVQDGLAVLATLDGEPFALPPGGGALPATAGPHTLRLSAGPAWEPWEGTVEADLELLLAPAIDTAGWALVDLFRDAAPSTTSRVDPGEDALRALAEGVALAILAPADEVGRAFVSDWGQAKIQVRSGSLADAPWPVLSWPWSADEKANAHGAIPWSTLDPQQLVAAATADGRLAVVDRRWVEAAPPPGTWDPQPDLFLIRDLEDLDAWFALLDAELPLRAVGPLAWSPVTAGGLPTSVEIERGLLVAPVATTGPLLTLQAVEGGARVRLQANREAAIRAVEIWADGELAWSAPVRDGHLEAEAALSWERWAVAVARGEGWAVSPALR